MVDYMNNIVFSDWEDVLNVLDKRPSLYYAEGIYWFVLSNVSCFTSLKGRSDDWFCRVGDYHHYLSEFVLNDSKWKGSIEKSLAAYKHASDLAISKLQAAHPPVSISL